MSSVATTIVYISQQLAIYSYLFIFIFGIIGNLSNILVFASVKAFRGNQCAFYLIALSISDCSLLLMGLPFRISELAFNYDTTRVSWIWCKLKPLITYTIGFMSASLICFAAIDQYLSTNHNPRLKRFSTLKLAYRLTYSALIVWTIYDCLFAIFFELRSSSGCTIYNVDFARFYSFFHFIVLTGLIPLFTASLFSLLAYLNVRRIIQLRMQVIRRKLEKQLTAMVLAKVAVFVVIVCPWILFRIYLLNVTVSPNDSLRLAIHQLISSISYGFYYANNAVCSFT